MKESFKKYVARLPSPILHSPKTPKNTAESSGEATSALRPTQTGLELEIVNIWLGPPPLPAYTPSPHPPFTHDMKNLIKLESGGKHILKEPFLVLCCKNVTRA